MRQTNELVWCSDVTAGTFEGSICRQSNDTMHMYRVELRRIDLKVRPSSPPVAQPNDVSPVFWVGWLGVVYM